MIYSVNNIAGRDAKSAEKRLPFTLAEKWKREYFEIVFYVRVWMALDVVKANDVSKAAWLIREALSYDISV